MVERLEHLGRQHGLKFTQAHSGSDVYLSSDMFYLQVALESNGGVKDVKVSHNSEVVVSCNHQGSHLLMNMEIIL